MGWENIRCNPVLGHTVCEKKHVRVVDAMDARNTIYKHNQDHYLLTEINR
jgi:hypothetical protein